MLYLSIPILFLFIGIAAGMALMGLVLLSKKYTFKWYTWLLSLAGLFHLLLGIAWSVTSVLEHESQAAGMGLILFAMPGIIMLFLTRRVLVTGKKA